MFEKILVPLDGSERAEMIVPYVQLLAEKLNSNIVLLRVVDPAVAVEGVAAAGLPYTVRVNDKKLVDALEAASAYLDDLIQTFTPLGVTANMRVEVGEVAGTILDVAAEEDVSFIAIASHGRTGVGNLVFGSVAMKVLHHSDIPLLLLRSPKEDLAD